MSDPMDTFKVNGYTIKIFESDETSISGNGISVFFKHSAFAFSYLKDKNLLSPEVVDMLIRLRRDPDSFEGFKDIDI